MLAERGARTPLGVHANRVPDSDTPQYNNLHGRGAAGAGGKEKKVQSTGAKHGRNFACCRAATPARGTELPGTAV